MATQKTITEFEDAIQQARDTYRDAMQSLLDLLMTEPNSGVVMNKITALQKSAVSFFNLFERSIDEYGLDYYGLNEDTKNRKVEDAEEIVSEIVRYWTTIRSVTTKYQLMYPKPSPNAYASIQRLLKHFRKEQVEQLKKTFMDNELPTKGFDGTEKFSGWKIGSKTSTIVQISLGVIAIAVSIFLSFYFAPLDGMQYFICRLLLSFGLMLVGSALMEATIDLKWTPTKAFTIKAAGWIAFFIVVYYINPPTAPKGLGKPTGLVNSSNETYKIFTIGKVKEKSFPSFLVTVHI